MTSKRRSLHFAASIAAIEEPHTGAALCGSGKQYGTQHEQMVTADFADVTCHRCIARVHAQNRAEDAAEQLALSRKDALLSIRDVLVDTRTDSWRELQSCADAIEAISHILCTCRLGASK